MICPSGSGSRPGNVEAMRASMEKARRTRLRRQNGAAKLDDVAAHANVSTATVSRFLNDPARVSPTAKERIKAAIDALGYMPHSAARALASNRTRTVGAIVPTLENAIFSAQIMSFQDRLQRDGYTLLLAASEYDPESESKQARVLLERGVDALMLVGQRRSPEVYGLITRLQIPYINTWLYDPDASHPCCGFDHDEAQGILVEHLVSLGHTRFGVLTGDVERNDRASARVACIRSRLGRHGIKLQQSAIVGSAYSFEAGRAALRRLLAAEPEITAVLAGNDVLAIGVLFEAKALGITVPQRLSVVGFGDLPISEHLDPPLTTVRTPKEEIGEAAAEYLLARLAGLEAQECIRLETRFCLRGTTHPVPETVDGLLT